MTGRQERHARQIDPYIDAAPVHTSEREIARLVALLETKAEKQVNRTWFRLIRDHRRALEASDLEPDDVDAEGARVYATCWLRSPVLQAMWGVPALIRRDDREWIERFVAGFDPPTRRARTRPWVPLPQRRKHIDKIAARAIAMAEPDRAAFLSARRTGARNRLARGGICGAQADEETSEFLAAISAEIARLETER